MLKLVSCATKCSSISSRSFTRIVSPCWLATPDDRRRDNQHYLPHHKRLSSSSTVSSKLLISHLTPVRVFSTSPIVPAKDGTWSRIKQMVRDYWYVIIPVEISLSVVSYAAIFLSLKSGVDIVHILTNIGVSQETLSKLPAAGGDAGYHALSFICYKVTSPVRHALSLGISTALVARLEATRPGYLKTSSSIVQEAKETGDDMREKYNEKVAEGMEKYDDMKEKYSEKVAEGREKYDEMKERYEEKKEEMKNRAYEKREDFKEKYDDWKKEK